MNKSNGSMKLINQLLNKKGFNFVEQEFYYVIPFDGKIVDFNVVISADDEILFVTAFSPVKVNKARLNIISEYLTRINFTFSVGLFTLNWENGDVSFRCTQLLDDKGLSEQIVEKVLDICIGTFENFIEDILDVAVANKSPQEMLKHNPLETE